jgi:hypothetical protein
MTARLRAAFSTAETQAMPDRITRVLREPHDNVVDLSVARTSREARRGRPLWAQAAAIAAALAVGIFTGNMLSGGAQGPIASTSGQLLASRELEHALDTRLASATRDDGARIGLTFREKGGAICRTFEVQAASGLACHQSGQWRIRSLFQTPDNRAGQYRMAGGADPQLMGAVEAAIVGEPFDAAKERIARDRNWQ